MKADEERLQEILEAMIIDNQTIGFQAVVRASNGLFKHASNLTTVETRRALVQGAIVRQDKIRQGFAGAADRSREELQLKIGILTEQKVQLAKDREFLVFAFKAICRTSFEAGGWLAFERFIKGHLPLLKKLHAMDALPSAEVLRFPTKE